MVASLRRQMLEQRGAELVHRPRAGGGRRPSGADRADRVDDRPVPAEQPGDPDPTAAVAEAEADGDDRRRKRPGQLRPQLGAGPAGGDGIEQPADLALDDVAEPLGDTAGAKRSCERRAVTGVCRPVEREHARPDHSGGREPRVIDGERHRVAQHLDRRRPPGDDEAVQRRHPGDRRRRPQPGEVRVHVACEVVDRRQLAQGSSTLFARIRVPAESRTRSVRDAPGGGSR